MPIECTSFLQQLIDDVFDPSLGDNPDLEHKSGSLKDLLKTGFRFLQNSSSINAQYFFIIYSYILVYLSTYGNRGLQITLSSFCMFAEVYAPTK